MNASTFPDPKTVGTSTTIPDAMFKAPIVVGDYVTIGGQWAGNTQPVGATVLPLFEVNNLVVNVELLTAPGTRPAYVTVEEVLFGITVPVSPDQPETRAVAFVTDPTQSLEWLAQDINPCSGAITERSIMIVGPQNPAAGGAVSSPLPRSFLCITKKFQAPAGRAIFRLGKTPFSPPPKNSVFRLALGTLQTNGGGAGATAGTPAIPATPLIPAVPSKPGVPAQPAVPARPAVPAVPGTPGDPTVGGILAGQFVNPTFDFTFPEVIPFGAPLGQLRFDNLEFLLKGAGPYVPGNVLAPAPSVFPRIRRLNPWPGVLPAGILANPNCVGTATAPPTQKAPVAAIPVAPVIVAPGKADVLKFVAGFPNVVRAKGGFDTINVAVTSSDKTGTAQLSVTLTATLAITPALLVFSATTKDFRGSLSEKRVATRLDVVSSLGGKICFNFDGTACTP